MEDRMGIEPMCTAWDNHFTAVDCSTKIVERCFGCCFATKLPALRNLVLEEGLEPPMFVWRLTKTLLSPLSHTGMCEIGQDRWS